MITFYQWLISESKQDIVSLGYPEVISKILYKHFGNLAHLVARWFRDYKYPADPKPANWWLQTTSSLRGASLWDLTDLYAATKDEETYKKALYRKGISDDRYTDLENEKEELEKQIENQFLNEDFFKDSFFKKILNKEIKNLNPYKKLSFQKAKEKYEKQIIFQGTKPLKIYENGYKWINVGKRCDLVGSMMKNCGSAGLMSTDEDSTMIVLFDENDKSHVVVTYSPNEKRISGDEGIASTAPKDKYHDYILDLAKLLGAIYDVEKSKSPTLIAKYLISKITNDFQELPIRSDWDAFFEFNVNGQKYFTNSREVVSEKQVEEVKNAIQQKQLTLKNTYGDIIQQIFNHQNRMTLLDSGVKFTRLNATL